MCNGYYYELTTKCIFSLTVDRLLINSYKLPWPSYLSRMDLKNKFLIDCFKMSISYHIYHFIKSNDLLASKISKFNEACSSSHLKYG